MQTCAMYSTRLVAANMLRGVKHSVAAMAKQLTVRAAPAAASLRARRATRAGMTSTALQGAPAWACSSRFAQQRWSSSSIPGLVDVDGTDRQTDAVAISERCAQRIIKVQGEGFLRLRVDGGGCSGFQYKFLVDQDALAEDDVVFERSGAKLVIDETSLDLVRGSTVDFVEEMISSSFQVLNNPNTESSCGCGSSFAPKS